VLSDLVSVLSCLVSAARFVSLDAGPVPLRA